MANSIQDKYRSDLDILKAISIIAVVFYHIGYLETGYLGVDVFFAINGFLIIPSLIDKIANSKFNYFDFLLRRIMRLWPLVLLAGAICLIVGFVGMLPDDYENVSQSVIASNFMSQNILSALTTKDYWDVANEYKPLMHFWYVGILIELYIFLPLVLLLIKCFVRTNCRKFINLSLCILAILATASFVLYCHPDIPQGDKFYLLPFRLWELILGGLIGVAYKNGSKKWKYSVSLGWGALVTTILVLCSSLYLPYTIDRINPVSGSIVKVLSVPQSILLISTVLLTCILLFNPIKIKQTVLRNSLVSIGKMSFSIFVWHQILLAFYRYFYSNDMTMIFVVCLWAITLIMAILTYSTMEQKIQSTWKNFVFCCVALFVISLPAGYVYLKAGIVRDVPELEVYVNNTHKGQFAEYCDRVYSYDVDFPDNDKINVIVEGVSFGRDFANILLESQVLESINLSYIYVHDEKYKERYANCDYLFTFSSKDDVPDYVWNSLRSNAKVFGLGTKNFGESNGVIYKNRNQTDYFEQTIQINPNFFAVNDKWKNQWGDYYIDLLGLSTTEDGTIRVFTDDKKYISQDCRHLTQHGAIWYARTIDWNNIFKQ
ncbi:MAG: acyltransferase [Tidjanibacter sp.]|nr:acyltransferase [Tidjanibacter sp.]